MEYRQKLDLVAQTQSKVTILDFVRTADPKNAGLFFIPIYCK